MTPQEQASKLFDDCRGASKAQAIPFIVAAIEEAKRENIMEVEKAELEAITNTKNIFETELLTQLREIAFQLTLIASLCTKVELVPYKPKNE